MAKEQTMRMGSPELPARPSVAESDQVWRDLLTLMLEVVKRTLRGPMCETCGEEAADIAGDAWFKFFCYYGASVNSSMWALARRVAENTCIDHWRKGGCRRLQSTDPISGSLNSVVEGAWGSPPSNVEQGKLAVEQGREALKEQIDSHDELFGQLLALFIPLPPHLRTIVTCVYVNRMSYQETAHSLQLSEREIGRRVATAREVLRAVYRAQYPKGDSFDGFLKKVNAARADLANTRAALAQFNEDVTGYQEPPEL